MPNFDSRWLLKDMDVGWHLEFSKVAFQSWSAKEKTKNQPNRNKTKQKTPKKLKNQPSIPQSFNLPAKERWWGGKRPNLEERPACVVTVEFGARKECFLPGRDASSNQICLFAERPYVNGATTMYGNPFQGRKWEPLKSCEDQKTKVRYYLLILKEL